ncbi:MAG: glycosyltransferase [Parvularculaceae bacterium]
MANDWQTLPAAGAFVDERGGCVVYDSHEFAREQFAEDPAWRCYIGPIAAAVEARYIPKAAEVTTVSPGIAETLERLYNLPRPIHVLRNTPRRVRLIHRAAAEPPRVLYHGVVAPSRGLENAIAAAALWRDGVSLHIRGPGKADYLQSLAALANRKGVGDRVRFHPAVAVDRLIEEAAAFDIGIFTLADTSLHKRYTLPNKVFEYLAAGLCLVVSDLPELRRLVEDTGAGVLVKEDSAAAIAAAIDQLHTEKLNGYRKAALAAASRYNWEAESPAALDAMEAAWTRAMDQSSGRRAPSFSS